jgi:hypothetical protein
MNMEQKTFYVAPEAKFSAARIRCSILVGSNGQGQTSEVKPSTGGNSGSVSEPSIPINGEARSRGTNSLGF